MLTAHLPAGYITGRALAGPTIKAEILWPALIGGVLPDIDMLYFYLVDQGGAHHHAYPTHWPLVWVGLCLPLILTAWAAGWPRLCKAFSAFLAGVMVHMLLDTVGAPIYWLMPFAWGQVELVEVPARYAHWIISFLLHWTFLLELGIWALAAFLFFRRPARRRIFAT